MSEDTKQFLIKLLGGGLIVGSIVVGVIRLSSPSNTPVTDDIEACVELRMDAIWEEYRRDPSPMSTFWEHPEPTFKVPKRFFKPRISLSAVSSPTATATEIAIQRSPADPNAAPINAFTAVSVFASGMTTA